ncbi:MAG: FkbM family methyltransferase [Ruminococcus sp.]|jgi:FkbM family methyltransferase|nr:FkbM family methyltransferase [Ruminococcus sp.]
MDNIETINVWDNIRSLKLPVYIYGMGDGADKVLEIMAIKGIEPAGVFASDEFVRGQMFHGFKVMKLSEVEAEVGEFVVVLAFGTNRPEVIAHIKKIAKKHPLFAPDMAVTGFDPNRLFSYREELNRVYSLFEDDYSKALFTDIVNFKISGKIDYLSRTTDFVEILPDLSEKEVFADCGAYTGDTIGIFCEKVNNKYKHIYGFEPSAKTFAKLQKNTANLENITLYNAAVWSENTEIVSGNFDSRNNSLINVKNGKNLVKAVRLDDIAPDATIVKLDVEGAEAEALSGMEKLLKRGVKLICAVYHKNDDLWEIPLLIKKINPDYRFKLRRIPCLPAWDIFLCAY